MSTTFEVANPATVVDLSECLAPGSRAMWHVMRRQLDICITRALRDTDGRAFAILGLAPRGFEAEAWFSVSPRAAKHMLSVVRAVRLTLEQLHYDPVYTVVSTPEGRRIARLSGFSFDQSVNNLEIWSWVQS